MLRAYLWSTNVALRQEVSIELYIVKSRCLAVHQVQGCAPDSTQANIYQLKIKYILISRRLLLQRRRNYINSVKGIRLRRYRLERLSDRRRLDIGVTPITNHQTEVERH